MYRAKKREEAQQSIISVVTNTDYPKLDRRINLLMSVSLETGELRYFETATITDFSRVHRRGVAELAILLMELDRRNLKSRLTRRFRTDLRKFLKLNGKRFKTVLISLEAIELIDSIELMERKYKNG